MTISILDELRSVSLSERLALPKVSAIYYIADDQAIMYIGKTGNLYERWRSHDKTMLMDDQHRIYWREVPFDDLSLVEDEEIEQYDPPWNGERQPGQLKSIKIPFSAWQALTRLCAATGEPRTRQLAKIIREAGKQQQENTQKDTTNNDPFHEHR